MKLKHTWKARVILLLLGASLSAIAQTFTTLYNFTNTLDGANPLRLTLANGLLFGCTANGGTNGNGTIFTFDTNSSALTTVCNFTGASDNGSSPNNVLVSRNEIYGTTLAGGTNNYGMVYAVGTNGSGFVSLYSFDGYPDGEYPRAGLVLNGDALYGTTYTGGVATNGGTVFSINTDGTGYATLYSFTNSPDGAQPQGELVLSGNTLYGVTTYGGANGKGTIFAINTDGTGYTILHSFTNAPEPIYPYGGMVLSAGVLYGTGSGGGTNANGAIFAFNTAGSGLNVLHSFSGFNGNTDGTTPKAALTLSGSFLCGTTVSGGSGNGGTVFLINTNGSGFAVLESFTNGAAGGYDPLGGVIRAGNGILGTTYQDGISNLGTLFLLPLPAISLQPQSVTVTNGNPAAFSVSAVDDSAISYQWYFNTNTVLTGQTNNTLTFASAATNNAGVYTVVVSDGSGSVTSAPAVLTVITISGMVPNILSFTLDPASGSASFVVTNTTGSVNRLWASTNLASPSFWRVIATNVMDSTGLWYFTDTNSAETYNQRFYRFSTP